MTSMILRLVKVKLLHSSIMQHILVNIICLPLRSMISLIINEVNSCKPAIDMKKIENETQAI